MKVVRALRLKKKDLLGASDPYVKLQLTEENLPSKKTTVKQKNLNPEWNEEFNFVVKDPNSQAIEFQVFDWEQVSNFVVLSLNLFYLGSYSLCLKVGKHDKMGINLVPLKELYPDEPKVFTLDLLKNMDLNDVQNEKNRGQIVVELTYKPFKEDELAGDFDDSQKKVMDAPAGTPENGGLLVVIVHEAQDVEGKHHNNPYVRLLFKGEEKRTKVSYDSCS